jgi:hypothetical protein
MSAQEWPIKQQWLGIAVLLQKQPTRYGMKNIFGMSVYSKEYTVRSSCNFVDICTFQLPDYMSANFFTNIIQKHAQTLTIFLKPSGCPIRFKCGLWVALHLCWCVQELSIQWQNITVVTHTGCDCTKWKPYDQPYLLHLKVLCIVLQV